MKEEIIKMVSKGGAGRKKCKRKEFKYLISQEILRERKIGGRCSDLPNPVLGSTRF
jgi:hypothetical protein